MATPSGPMVMVSKGGRWSSTACSAACASPASSGRPRAESTACSVSGPTSLSSPCASCQVVAMPAASASSRSRSSELMPAPSSSVRRARLPWPVPRSARSCNTASSSPAPRAPAAPAVVSNNVSPCAEQATASSRRGCRRRSGRCRPPSRQRACTAASPTACAPMAWAPGRCGTMRACRSASSRRCSASTASCGGWAASSGSGMDAWKVAGRSGRGCGPASPGRRRREPRELRAGRRAPHPPARRGGR